jgi:hypothetical protein
MKQNKTMEELHRIREEHYNEVKGLTIEERIEKTRAETDAIIAELGLTVLSDRGKAAVKN